MLSGGAFTRSAPAGVSLPAAGQYVAVTGISSCEAGAYLKPIRLMRVRKQGDIVPFAG